MNLLKFIYLFYKIKVLFSYLPKALQEEIISDMQGFLGLCQIAKYEKLKGGKNECC